MIPDVVAFRLFFSVAGENPSSPASASSLVTQKPTTARQLAVLRPVQLSRSDEEILCSELAFFKSNFATAAAANRAIKTQSTAVTPSPDDIAQQTIENLRQKLSSGGFQRLETYVQAQKQFMKIVPYPDMTGHAH